LTNGQLAELAFQGLLPAIKDKYSAQEFESLGHIIQRVSAHESRYQDSRGGWYQKKVARVGSVEFDSEEDNEVGLAEWTRNKKLDFYPWVKIDIEKYSFNINKVDQIFDFFLMEKKIHLCPNHNIPLAVELKNKKYCKWHNSNSHSTNECKVFHQQIQSAIEQERIQIKKSKKPMKIDQHPFPTSNVNMVELKGGKIKVLLSQRARESGSVDPKVQTPNDEDEDGGHHARQDGSRGARRPRVTSQMLLSKSRRQQEKDRRRREVELRDQESHWCCQFFAYCWNEGLRLPSVQDCP
jgi:hypothetical protein